MSGVVLSELLKFSPPNALRDLLDTARAARLTREGFRRILRFGAARRRRRFAMVVLPFVATLLTVARFAEVFRVVLRLGFRRAVRFFVVVFFVRRRFRRGFSSRISFIIPLCPPL
jgi:hypothetical protein